MESKMEGMPTAPSGSDHETMAWDIRRQAYIWEDPTSGAVFLWDETTDKWVLDDTLDRDDDQDEDIGKGITEKLHETYDPLEGSDLIDLSLHLRKGNNSKKGKDNNKNKKDDPQKGKEIKKETTKKEPTKKETKKETTKETTKKEKENKNEMKIDDKEDSTTTNNTTEEQKDQSEEKDQKEGDSKNSSKEDEKKKKRKRKTKKKKPNCTLYITGLPKDVTEEEFVNFFKTPGIIAKDSLTLQPKIKIYKDESGVPKGDGLVTYLKALAVTQAFQLLDGFDFRPPENHIIKLELAKFENKEGKPRPQVSKKQKRYNQESQELGWEEQEQRHVIIKHMFDPDEAAKDIDFYDNLREEIEAEFNRIGAVEALKIFERHPEGVVAVKYTHQLDAERCIERMNGRWFDGRQLVTSFYDGFSNYYVPESEEQSVKRDIEWAKWLTGNDAQEEKKEDEK